MFPYSRIVYMIVLKIPSLLLVKIRKVIYWADELVYACRNLTTGSDVGCVVVSVLCEFHLVHALEPLQVGWGVSVGGLTGDVDHSTGVWWVLPVHGNVVWKD